MQQDQTINTAQLPSTDAERAPRPRCVSFACDRLRAAIEAAAAEAGWLVDAVVTDAAPPMLAIVDLSDEPGPGLAWLADLPPGLPRLVIARADQDEAVKAAARGGPISLITAPTGIAAIAAQLRLAAIRPVAAARPRLTVTSETASSLKQAMTLWLDEPGDAVVHAMLIGLQRLDAINTTYGDATGDAALRTAAARIHAELAGQMLVHVAHLGGSAFLVVSRQPFGRDGWKAMADRLVAALAGPLAIDGQRIRLTARVALGLAKSGETLLSLLDRLAAALARARQHETLLVRWADRRADRAPTDGYRLEQDLMHAIDRDEIAIRFQPQFSVAGGRLVGAEVLARWNHGALGEIDAVTLFELAAKTDYTRALSAHIRDRALAAASRWSGAMTGLRLSLNLTAQDLADADFAERLIAAVGVSGFAPDRLTVEITETALLPELDQAVSRLEALRAAGIAVAIDDFGTGYANLAYLKALPLDYLKLDHGMTRDIDGGPRDRIIVRSIIALAQALSLGVIAEGVESEAQLAALADERCDYFQGFLRGAAMPEARFAAFAEDALGQ